MTSLANSAHSICNYCGAEYNTAYGSHLCDIDQLLTLIHQERTMTDAPNERDIAKLQGRIKEIRAFYKAYPNHQSELSHRISS